jgi:hypothetical protein
MRAILKGLLLALFVCALPIACGPEEPGSVPLSSVPEPVNMSADHPFIFAIAERETGEILFLGRVTDPKRRSL